MIIIKNFQCVFTLWSQSTNFQYNWFQVNRISTKTKHGWNKYENLSCKAYHQYPTFHISPKHRIEPEIVKGLGNKRQNYFEPHWDQSVKSFVIKLSTWQMLCICKAGQSNAKTFIKAVWGKLTLRFSQTILSWTFGKPKISENSWSINNSESILLASLCLPL